MEKNVFIAPVSVEHINRATVSDEIIKNAKELVSVEGLIPIDLILDTLNEEQRVKLHDIFPDGRIRIWGTQKSSKSTWDSLSPGDYILFYKGGFYIYLAEAADLKMDNNNLARKIWGEYAEGVTWNLVFFIRNVLPIRISRKELNEIAGYDKDFIPRGFKQTNEEAATRIVARIVGENRRAEVSGKDILDQLCEKEKLFSRIIKTAFAHLVAGKNIVFYGPPATSKTYLAKKICESICKRDNFSIETANAEWSHFDMIGGRTVDGFREGIILRATEECEESINSGGRPHWLIIDELNRANLDLAFGEIFTQLDINHREKSLKPHGVEKEYFVPLSFRIIATMNTYDRSLLFSLGYAFMRRFAFIQVESLFKHPEEESGELKVPDDIGNVLSNSRIKEIKEIAFSSVLEHFSTKKKDKAFLFRDFELSSDQLKEILNRLKVGDLDIIDLLNYISYKITDNGLVEIGHAIVFDAAKFAVAYHLLSPEEANVKMLLDEAISAYLLPQLEYFMPKLRKGKILGEGKFSDSWENIEGTVKKLNLSLTLRRLEKAEEDFRVI